MMENCEEPQEFFLKIEGHDHLLGRILIHASHEFEIGEVFNAEIDIVQRDSKKIWLHVGYLFKLNSQEEAIELSVQKIAHFLKNGDH